MHERDLETNKENGMKTSKTDKDGKEKTEGNINKVGKKDQFIPLPMVSSPQKLSRKNFDKHKISSALLKVVYMLLNLVIFLKRHLYP